MFPNCFEHLEKTSVVKSWWCVVHLWVLGARKQWEFFQMLAQEEISANLMTQQSS